MKKYEKINLKKAKQINKFYKTAIRKNKGEVIELPFISTSENAPLVAQCLKNLKNFYGNVTVEDYYVIVTNKHYI